MRLPLHRLLGPANTTSLRSVGSVLCPPHQLVPVVSAFSAQIIVFDLKYPITAGSAVELFHHSKDIPATISTLDAELDKTSGAVIKTNPRYVLTSFAALRRRLSCSLQDAQEVFVSAHSCPASTTDFRSFKTLDYSTRDVCGEQEYGSGAVPAGWGDDW